MKQGAGLALGLVLLLGWPGSLIGQDSVAVAPRLLPLDTARVRQFERTYDMVVQSLDSTFVIGERRVRMAPSRYAGSPAWLLVETRTGIVPAVESLFVTPDMRPIHWSSRLGSARLGAQFVRDSIFGATSSPAGRQNIVMAARSDLVVSTAMAEALLQLFPLGIGRSDSAALLSVDLASTTVIPAEVTVIGDESLFMDSIAFRASWVVALKTEPSYVLFWIDKESGGTLRVQYALPGQGGALLEYRARDDIAREPR